MSDLGRIQFLELVLRRVLEESKEGQNGSAAFAFDRLSLIQQYAETALAVFCQTCGQRIEEQRLNKNDPDWMFDELMTWPARKLEETD